jgi:hypothetical protein
MPELAAMSGGSWPTPPVPSGRKKEIAMNFVRTCGYPFLGGITALAAACIVPGCSAAPPSGSESTNQVGQALGCGTLGQGQTLASGGSLFGCDRETILDNDHGQLHLDYDDVSLWNSPNSDPGGDAEMLANGDFVLWAPDHSRYVWHTNTVRVDAGALDNTNYLQIVPFGLEVVDGAGTILWADWK